MSKDREALKLLLLHGPAIEASRKKLIEIKKEFNPDSVVTLEKGTSVGEVLENIQTVSMFGDERLVILENPQEIPPLTLDSNVTLVFWFDREVDPDKIGVDTQVFFFPEAKEVSVFPFLRLLGGRKKEAFTEMQKLKNAGFESQYFMTMILYLLRNLVSTPKKAAEFVRRNNEIMRKNFTKEELVNLYKSILETDFKIKKGLMEETQAEHSLVSRFLN